MSQRMSGEDPPPPYDRVVIHIPPETGTYCRWTYQKVSDTGSFDFNAKLSLVFTSTYREIFRRKKVRRCEMFI
jgi:hypothetical protein